MISAGFISQRKNKMWIFLLQGESLMFQNRYATLIGQSKRQDVMIGQLGMLRNFESKSLRAFLDQCICGSTRTRNEKCTDLNHYERSNYVAYKGNQLKDLGDESFPKLSSFFIQYLNDILDEIYVYFPNEGQKSKAKLKMSAFDPFDHQRWPTSRAGVASYVPGSIKDVSNMFGVTYSNTLQMDFNDLVSGILKNSLDIESQDIIGNQQLGTVNHLFWCKHKKDDHLVFWIHVLEKFAQKLTGDLELLLRKILTVPMGSG